MGFLLLAFLIFLHTLTRNEKGIFFQVPGMVSQGEFISKDHRNHRSDLGGNFYYENARMDFIQGQLPFSKRFQKKDLFCFQFPLDT